MVKQQQDIRQRASEEGVKITFAQDLETGTFSSTQPESNFVYLPINMETNGDIVNGVQMTFDYDKTKLHFNRFELPTGITNPPHVFDYLREIKYQPETQPSNKGLLLFI